MRPVNNLTPISNQIGRKEGAMTEREKLRQRNFIQWQEIHSPLNKLGAGKHYQHCVENDEDALIQYYLFICGAGANFDQRHPELKLDENKS